MTIPDTMPCYCGHDCAKCVTFRATLLDDDTLRAKAQDFYRTEFHQERPLESFYCRGGRSDEIMDGCKQCPYMKCCKEKGLSACADCGEYPCQMLGWYLEKYVNKSNQM